MNNLTRQLLSFFYFGIIIVIFIAGIIIFSWLLLAGAIVGFILFLVVWIRQTFFMKEKSLQKKTKPPGRIIDHDDN